MIDVKEATAKAREHLESFFPESDHVQLEEVELSGEKDFWYITLSFHGSADSVASSLLVGGSVRYKVFKLDANSGEVISMKNRDIRDIK